MDKITHEVRLKQWKQIIEQCQARPEGQSAKKWLAENGIKEKTYYYWLRRVRQQAYDQMESGAALPAKDGIPSVTAAQSEPTVAFAEIPFALGNDSSCTYDSFQPAAVIKTGVASVAFSNAASASLLSGIIREVLGHA